MMLAHGTHCCATPISEIQPHYGPEKEMCSLSYDETLGLDKEAALADLALERLGKRRVSGVLRARPLPGWWKDKMQQV